VTTTTSSIRIATISAIGKCSGIWSTRKHAIGASRSVHSPSPQSFSFSLRLLALLFVAGTSDLVVPTEAGAQNLFGDSGFSSSHSSYSSVPYEHVDPLSGNLIVVVNDLSLPGNAGLGLSVTRSYNSKFHRDFENNDTTLVAVGAAVVAATSIRCGESSTIGAAPSMTWPKEIQIGFLSSGVVRVRT
jgi:hypothetical protein